MDENRLGMNPPFLLRNIYKQKRKYKQNILEKECCSISLTDIDERISECEIKGYVKTQNGIIPVKVDFKKPIVLFSCFDELKLYFYTVFEKKVRMYYLSVNGCRNRDQRHFKAYEMGLFGQSQFVVYSSQYINVKLRIRNLRPEKSYHYNISDNYDHVTAIKPRFNVKFREGLCSVDEFQCVLCLNMFNNLDELINHINFIHFSYSCKVDDNVLHVMPCDKQYRSSKDDINDIINSSTKNLNADIYIIDKNDELKYKHHDRSKIYDGSMDNVKRMKNQCFSKVIKTVISDHITNLYSKGGKLFYFKKRNGKKIEYKLNNYYILIEKEYNTLNYLPSITDHSVSRIENNDSDSFKIIKRWNSLRIAEDNNKGNLAIMICEFGICSGILNLIEILYTNSILNSSEIMESLEFYEVYKNKINV